MAVKLTDRPIETVREETIDQLIMNYSHGRLSYEAFERRLDQAMETSEHQVLADLTEDLDLTVDSNYVATKSKGLGANVVAGEVQDVEKIINIFSGSTREGNWPVAKETNMVSVFSGSEIDLSQAQFSEKVHTIKLFSLFSGDSIYVPENVRIINKTYGIFGSVSVNFPDKITNQYSGSEVTLVVEGYAIFSGIDIEVKRTLKEKFVDFADSLKKLFS